MGDVAKRGESKVATYRLLDFHRKGVCVHSSKYLTYPFSPDAPVEESSCSAKGQLTRPIPRLARPQTHSLRDQLLITPLSIITGTRLAAHISSGGVGIAIRSFGSDARPGLVDLGVEPGDVARGEGGGFGGEGDGVGGNAAGGGAVRGAPKGGGCRPSRNGNAAGSAGGEGDIQRQKEAHSRIWALGNPRELHSCTACSTLESEEQVRRGLLGPVVGDQEPLLVCVKRGSSSKSGWRMGEQRRE